MKKPSLLAASCGCGRGAFIPQFSALANNSERGEGTPPTRSMGSLRRAFSLLELLVVIGLIAVLAAVFIGEKGSGSQAPAVQSAQALLFNLLTTARTNALATGRSARVLVQMDAAGSNQSPRFLHLLALQIQTSGGWQTLTEVPLPEGVYVVPGNYSMLPTGLFADPAGSGWVKTDGSALRSTALRENQLGPEAINGAEAEQWVSIILAPNGSTIQSGDIVLAPGRRRAPASYQPGESPVELTHASMVRGLSLSSYGVPALINDRTGF